MTLLFSLALAGPFDLDPDPVSDLEETLLQRDIVPLDTLRTRCDSGGTTDCHRLGRRFEQGFGGTPVSFADAGAAYLKACDRGLILSCGLAGGAYARLNDPQGAALARRGCDAGDGAACGILGHFELVGLGVPQDAKSGAQRLETACTAGHGFACSEFALALAGAVPGLPADPVRARPLLETSCKAGDQPGCVWLGTLLLTGAGGPADTTRGLELLQTGCDASDPASCEALAAAWLNGMGVQASAVKSVPYLRRSCDLGSGMACAHLASMQLQGAGGLTVDRDKALTLLGRSCDLGLQDACGELKKACASGVPTACR